MLMPPVPASLPVETFEDFMLADDTAEYPMSFAFEMKFDRPVEGPRLESAAAECAVRHPLLFSRLAENGKRWIFDAGLVPRLTRGDLHQSLRFNLRTSSGLRLLVPDDDAAANQLAFVFHHACVDGLGALQFIRDVLDRYSGSPAPSSDSRPNPDLLASSVRYLARHRSSAGRNRLVHFLRWPVDLAGMLWSLEMIFNRPRPIQPATAIERPAAGVTSPAATGASLDCTLKQIFSPEESHRIKQLGRASGQTVNDRIMEAFFLAIQTWNERFNPDHAESLVRLMIPVNLRGKPPVSAANMVAMVNFDRSPGRWKSASWFRKILRLEMRVVKFVGAGITANRYLWLQKKWFGHWPMQTNQGRCLASCLLSNLGNLAHRLGGDVSRPIRFGELEMSGFRVIAPLRQNSNLFLCVYTHEHCLHMDATFNPAILDGRHTQILLEAARMHLLSDT